jgi:CTP-dependent riboflavin kinase
VEGIRLETQLTFKGRVIRGVGRFAAELIVPGASRVSAKIRDWPESMQPGTLNVRLSSSPDKYLAAFGALSVQALDTRIFRPEAEIPLEEIQNNTLSPTQNAPDRGNAQIWRVTLKAGRTGFERRCWVLRRIGSGLTRDLELVAGEHLRSELALEDGDEVTLILEGVWV